MIQASSTLSYRALVRLSRLSDQEIPEDLRLLEAQAAYKVIYQRLSQDITLLRFIDTHIHRCTPRKRKKIHTDQDPEKQSL